MVSKTCSFFGHRFVNDKEKIRKKLKIEIERQIWCGFDRFIVGTHGDFDNLVLTALRDLKNNIFLLK